MKKINLFKITLSAFVFLLVGVLGNTVQAEEYIDDPSQLPDPDAYKAVVKIKSFYPIQGNDMYQYSAGSGILISSSGIILTNYHVVTLEDQFDEGEYPSTYQICLPSTIDQEPDCHYVAKLIAKDKDQDLALLKMEPISGLSTKSSGFKYLNLASSDDTSVNDDVIVMGYPAIGGSTITITKGIVSGKEEKYYKKWIKTDAVFSFGSSGGAAINDDGEVIGIVNSSHSDYLGSLGYLINSASIYDWVNVHQSVSAQDSDYLDDLKEFTKKQVELETSDVFDNNYFSITKPSDWEFTYVDEYQLFMDKPSDDDGGYIIITMVRFPHEASLDVAENILREGFLNQGVISMMNFSKVENVTINGKPAKKIVVSSMGETKTLYFFVNKDYLFQIDYDYGTNDKDEDLVKDTINTIDLDSGSANIEYVNQYTNALPKFSIKTSGGWHILERMDKEAPIKIYNNDYPNAYMYVRVEETDENTDEYNNQEYIDHLKQSITDTVNSVGSTLDVRAEVALDDDAYYLNNELDDIILFDSSMYKDSTDEMLVRDTDYIVKVGDKYLYLTFRMFGATDSEYEEVLEDAQDVIKTFSLTSTPNSAESSNDNDDVDEDTPDTNNDDQVSNDVDYTPPPATGTLSNRLRGRILLQVENNGEAWYVKPDTGRRIYMKDGDVAYDMMRNLGLGITNADLEKIPVGIEDRFECADNDGDGLCNKLEEGLGTDPNDSDSDDDGHDDGTEVKGNYNPLGSGSMQYSSTMVNNLRGKILLQVESRGEAWYINPEDGKRYYMPDGPSAYQIMRYLSLGITNNDLSQISEE